MGYVFSSQAPLSAMSPTVRMGRRGGAESKQRVTTANRGRGQSTMAYEAINLGQKLALFGEHWSPRVVATLNDYQLKLVKLQGEFVWHAHDHTDEVFIVLSGEMDILFRDGRVTLREGEMFVVPKGLEHKPVAADECHVLLVEPDDVVNTGDAGGPLTAEQDRWV